MNFWIFLGVSALQMTCGTFSWFNKETLAHTFYMENFFWGDRLLFRTHQSCYFEIEQGQFFKNFASMHGVNFWDRALSLVKEQSPEKWEEEVEVIDQAVIKLTDLRNKELSKAAWAQNQGDRLQFQPNSLIDARRYWNEADTSREIAARYQEEIEKLQDRKKKILDQQGIQHQH